MSVRHHRGAQKRACSQAVFNKRYFPVLDYKCSFDSCVVKVASQAGQPMHQGQQPRYYGSPSPSHPPHPPQGYGPPQQGYAPPQQGGFGPPPGQQQYAGGPPLQGHGHPPPQQQGYGAPPNRQQGYGHQPSYSLQQTAGFSGQLSFAPPQGEAQTPSYTGLSAPDQEVYGNENAAPPPPTAPPAEMFGTYAGYENTGFGTAYLPPPPPYEPPAPQQTPEQHFLQATAITEDQARDALLAFIAENCCYGKKAAKDMEIKDITPSSAYHYNFESFCESRTTTWKYDPYRGQQIDGPQNGPAPQPWDILVQPNKMFMPQEAHIEVPHTATVKPCHNCLATGYKCCYQCFGRKKVRCRQCRGSGKITEFSGGGPGGAIQHTTRCDRCRGSKWQTCDTCNGDGRVTCWTCQGQCRLKVYIQLTIKWECHVDNHVTERTDLPDHLVLGSQGTDIFIQELPRVYPITAFHDQDVNRGSQALVEAHSRNWPSKRIIMQRHKLRAVPVSVVKYEWKDTNTRYWVYGLDHKVHAPDYPQQCCCGCTLL